MTRRDSVRHRGGVIEYELRRSRRRKKTMEIAIRGGGVRVTVPWRAPNDQVRAFVRRRAEWIVDQLAASSERASRNRIADGDVLPYLGRDVRLVVDAAGGPGPAARLDGDSLIVSAGGAPSGNGRADPVRAAVVAWYLGRAAEILPAKVDRWLPRAVYYRPIEHPHDSLLLGGLPPHTVDDRLPRLGHASRPRVLIRDQKTLWGSCAHDGTIRINWRAVMLVPPLIDYIVVHELTHLDVKNHSPAFWELASTILPDARGLRRRLREVERTLPWWTWDRT